MICFFDIHRAPSFAGRKWRIARRSQERQSILGRRLGVERPDLSCSLSPNYSLLLHSQQANRGDKIRTCDLWTPRRLRKMPKSLENTGISYILSCASALSIFLMDSHVVSEK